MPPRKIRRLISLLRRKPKLRKYSKTRAIAAKKFIGRKRFTSLRSRFSKTRTPARWSMLRKRFGRGRTLTYKKAGVPNTLILYKSKYAKPRKINRSFDSKVAESSGHLYRMTDCTNGDVTAVPGEGAWTVVLCGTAAQYQSYYTMVQENNDGYGQADPNTTLNNISQQKMQIKVLKNETKVQWVNNGTSSVNICVYELVPRIDLAPTTQFASPNPSDLLIAHGQDGDLLRGGGSAMLYTDPRFTPYMVPSLCSKYLIVNSRKFVVGAGQNFETDVAVNNVTVNPFDQSTAAETLYFKGKSKMLLVHSWGELGVVTDGAGAKYVRHLPHELVFKSVTEAQFRASKETRIIFTDNNVSRNNAVGFTGTTTHMDEQTGVLITYGQEAPTSTT